MAKFGDAERNIASLLSIGSSFEMNGKLYTIVNSGKPTCYHGEPKTDIYVLAEDKYSHFIELKISFKKENADFIENKTNPERAEALFGNDWQSIIMEATMSIREAFLSKKLIYKSGYGRTEEGAITLGWKYELLNKPGGELSGIVDLTRSQIIDVYSGTHLSSEKTDAMVNGCIIENSGIANYMLMNDGVETTQDVIDSIISSSDYVDEHPRVYFACKALNYRTYYNKYDGNRPLSVYIDWQIQEGKLDPILVFDNPLCVGGNEAADALVKSLRELNIKDTRDISKNMLTAPQVIYE